MVAPSGGNRDTNPPVVDQEKTFPKNYSTNFNSDEIVLEFNEYFNLSNPSKNIIITPTLENKPEYKIKNKRLTINLNNTLSENTTYTINFGESISDITEGNILKNFKYVFSTGDELDSLELKGYIYDAFTKKPIEDAAIMLYNRFEDSIPLKEKPYYFAKSIGSGWFNISNIKEGAYKLVALKEVNNNLIFDSNEELIAFSDTLITINKPDSTSGKIKLYAFQEIENDLYVTDKKYYFNNLVTIKFNKVLTDSLNAEFIPRSNFETYRYPETDSIQYFVSDKVEVEKIILKNDHFLDTIRLRQNKPKQKRLDITLAEKKITIVDSVKILSAVPVVSIDESLISLEKDSVSVDFEVLNSKKETLIIFDKTENSNYNLTLRKGAITDGLGYKNDSISYNVAIKSPSYYGSIVLTLDNLKQTKYLLELIKGEEVIKRNFISQSGDISFKGLEPGDYQFRLIEDKNNNQKWDTGNYLKGTQAEPVFNFSKKITIRSNWDINETWKLKSD